MREIHEFTVKIKLKGSKKKKKKKRKNEIIFFFFFYEKFIIILENILKIINILINNFIINNQALINVIYSKQLKSRLI